MEATATPPVEVSPTESAKHRLMWALLIVVMIGVFTVAGVDRYNREANKLPVFNTVGEFSLIDQRGQTISNTSLRGKVWIASFIFTRCSGTCISIANSVHDLEKMLPTDIELVSFSMDPEYDKGEVLTKYASDRNLENPRWHFLTGNKEQIVRATRDDFRMAIVDANANTREPIIHSSHLALIDRDGRIRGMYSGTDDEGVQKVAHDAQLLDGALTVKSLPAVNATINGICTIVLLAGYTMIRQKRIVAHQICMIAAGALSALFLGCYLYYHAHVGHVEFKGQGVIRPVYLGILLTHVLLAFSIAVLVPLTFARALRNDLERHRKIARITFPIWLYVSVTGVVVYLMLYHM
jgi:protein SCO1/2/putative membrane protein